jgi:hypothetical protein
MGLNIIEDVLRYFYCDLGHLFLCYLILAEYSCGMGGRILWAY